jgi:hypothetical protein
MKNIEKAIAIMKRAGEVDMDVWQAGVRSSTEVYAHLCGTVCCLGGWIALSPEFQADGGTVGEYGEPVLDGCTGERAIRNWMGLRLKVAYALCMIEGYSVYDSEEPTKEDVIKALETLLETGRLEVTREEH